MALFGPESMRCSRRTATKTSGRARVRFRTRPALSLRALSPPECSLDDLGKPAGKARLVGRRRIADRLHLGIRLAVVGSALVRDLLARYQDRSCILRNVAGVAGLFASSSDCSDPIYSRAVFETSLRAFCREPPSLIGAVTPIACGGGAAMEGLLPLCPRALEGTDLRAE